MPPAVQAGIAAMPAWKREVEGRLDALIVRTLPGVRKGVKWSIKTSWMSNWCAAQAAAS